MITHDPHGTAFAESGSGPSVVLVHGLGLRSAMWQWQLPDLEPHFRVLVYDLLGHGESAPPPGSPDLAMFSDQLLRLMDHCAVETAGVVGFSLGGMIARRFAIDHPDRVAALAILNSAHDRTAAEREAVRARVRQAEEEGPSATAEAALERWFTPGFRAARPRVVSQVREWILANDPAIYPEIYRVLADGDVDIRSEIRRIACPTLVMTGDEDRGNSPEMARAMAEGMPQARVVILPGLRHMALAESPQAFNPPLVSFLRDALGG